MEIRSIDPLNDPRWDALIAEQPGSSLYHTSTWLRFVHETYAYRPLAVAVEDGGRLRSALPAFFVNCTFTGRRFVCLSFSDYGDPLLGDPSDLDRLLTHLREAAAARRASIELRTRGAVSPEPAGFTAESRYVIHLIDLTPGIDGVYRLLRRNARYCIRRAEKARLTVRAARDAADMRTFYALYVGTRREQGLPPQPYAFFRNMWRRFGPDKGLHLNLAMDGAVCLAGSLGIVHKSTFHALYAASRRDALELRPNHLLYWHEIRLAVEAGLRTYDLGRTALDNAGLLHFKDGWSATRHPLVHYYWPAGEQSRIANRKGSAAHLARRVIRRMPRPLLRLAGELIYRHIG
jgi:CelD/BcsL family acetyltransferase involved in cellulose biosynthesis